LLLLQARKYLNEHSTGTVTIARAMMGRWKKVGNQFSPSNRLVQEPEGNEENKHSNSDSKKTKIIYAKELNEAHKNNLKEEILQEINENFIEMILDMVNQNVQETLKKFQDNKNKKFEKAQEKKNRSTV
jgi:DNA-binding protein Fis